jgi:hypothetical protein
VNPVYAILESPHRWSILASAAFVTGIAGAIVIITYNWSHWFGRVWFIVWFVASLFFVARLVLDWKNRVAEELSREVDRQAPGTGT